jgi:hypothetical protein
MLVQLLLVGNLPTRLLKFCIKFLTYHSRKINHIAGLQQCEWGHSREHVVRYVYLHKLWSLHKNV